MIGGGRSCRESQYFYDPSEASTNERTTGTEPGCDLDPTLTGTAHFVEKTAFRGLQGGTGPTPRRTQFDVADARRGRAAGRNKFR